MEFSYEDWFSYLDSIADRKAEARDAELRKQPFIIDEEIDFTRKY
jgi:hypothetical protein